MNAVTLHRLNYWAYKKKIPLISHIVNLLTLLIYNSRIGSSCQIGEGTKLAYKGIGVLIVKGAKIGKNCSLGAGCKIVRKFPYKNVAEIGDNVYVGPGAVICGPVRIGDNVIIAPNSVVNHSVQEGGIVGGIPAKLIGNVKNLDYNIHENPQYKEGWSKYLDSGEKYEKN